MALPPGSRAEAEGKAAPGGVGSCSDSAASGQGARTEVSLFRLGSCFGRDIGRVPVAPMHPGDRSGVERSAAHWVTNSSVCSDGALAPGLSLTVLPLRNLGKEDKLSV